MNATQVNSFGSGQGKNRANGTANRTDVPQANERHPGSQASQLTKGKKTQNANSSPATNKAKQAKKPSENNSPEINEYLKIISRLENKAKDQKLNKEEMEKVTKSLEERIVSLSDQQKTQLRNLKFLKEKGIKNIKELNSTLTKMFNDNQERGSLFDFLKSPDFMAILLNEKGKPDLYSPPKPGPNMQNAKPKAGQNFPDSPPKANPQSANHVKV